MVTILSLLDFQLRLLLDAFEGIIIALSVKVSPSATIMLFVFIDISVTLKTSHLFRKKLLKQETKLGQTKIIAVISYAKILIYDTYISITQKKL